MKIPMANITKWNNNKPTFRLITIVVVKCSHFITARTSQRCGWNQYANSYGISNNVLCFNFILIMFAIFGRALPTPWSFLVITTFFIIGYFTFFGMSILTVSCFLALFTSPRKTILSGVIFEKFVKRFNSFTLFTFFGYNCLSHNFSPFQKVMVRAVHKASLCAPLALL